MTKRQKISGDYTISNKPKSKYHKPHPEGYGFQNGDFCFSDNLDDWKYGKTRRGARYPDLF